ncbi:AbrB/MazE/SpoVT family DNA-binding domain-containing protein [Halarsenatibacter silvermanii]|uniref:Transcriptional regulator, AbrB family n=1 Tax=Halarsenatibacter silvermanii TaxID=321763 RepID=A0A1G9SEA0_9FIRM|nr:AbrB/MazE/SpoVT family DNA-binding domain-containing protein [Halarsenatibacter silvermanii]SDM33647.1 transcriptional regulator, AbrB family [Halarsenatibacter silvermanii]
MKATGIVRRVDQLGRIVLPKELRQTLNIDKKDPMEIYVEDETVILKKYEPGCTLCSSVDELVSYKGKNVCEKCIEKLKDIEGSS